MKALLSQRWSVIGISEMSCVFTVTCFSLFSRRSKRNVFTCLEFLSLTSGISSHEFSGLLPWLIFLLGHFVSDLTCWFRTFVFCKVTGLLVFIVYLEHLVLILDSSNDACQCGFESWLYVLGFVLCCLPKFLGWSSLFWRVNNAWNLAAFASFFWVNVDVPLSSELTWLVSSVCRLL